MKKTLIIGASGRARSGKSEVCNAIADHVRGEGGRAELYDIGEIIRKYAIIDGRLPQIERKDMTREHLATMIAVGKEKRAEDEDFWIRQVMHDIGKKPPHVALIPNLRFLNEAAAVSKAGGFVVRIVRLNPNGSHFISQDRDCNDRSETDLELWNADFEIRAKNEQHILACEFGITLFCYLAALHGG